MFRFTRDQLNPKVLKELNSIILDLLSSYHMTRSDDDFYRIRDIYGNCMDCHLTQKEIPNLEVMRKIVLKG